MSSNTVVSILGHKGSGKTTLARELAEEHDRVLVLDTLGEYHGETFTDVGAILRAMERPPKRFRWIARLADLSDYFDLFEVAFEITGHLLVVEETSFFCSPSNLPPELSKLVRYGRHREIDLLFVSRRPSEVNRDLTAQSDFIVSFRQHEPRDLAYLSAVSGRDASFVRGLAPYKVALLRGEAAEAPLPIQRRLGVAQQAEMPLTASGGEQ